MLVFVEGEKPDNQEKNPLSYKARSCCSTSLRGAFFTVSKLNWNLEVLGFVEGEKLQLKIEYNVPREKALK